MANDAKIRVNLQFSKNDRRVNYNKSYFSSVSGDNYSEFIQNIGITNETITPLDSGTEGLCILENLNTTYSLFYGASQSYTHKVAPGETSGVFRWNAALYGTTASNIDIKVVLLEA